MTTSYDSRYLVERIALFLLGIAATITGASFSAGLWPFAITLVVAAVVAVLIEVASVARSGARHRVAAWLPVVLGMVALATVTIALEEKGPDSGLALSIVVASFLVVIPAFALLVNLLVIVMLRFRQREVQ